MNELSSIKAARVVSLFHAYNIIKVSHGRKIACLLACGTAVSYAVTTEGQLFSWGMGTNGQLGTGEEEDLWQPTLMKSRQLEGRRVLAVSAGGQHTLVLARDA